MDINQCFTQSYFHGAEEVGKRWLGAVHSKGNGVSFQPAKGNRNPFKPAKGKAHDGREATFRALWSF